MKNPSTVLRKYLWPASAKTRIILYLSLAVILALLMTTPDRSPAELIAKYRLSNSYFFNHKGSQIHYTDKGRGLTIVMVHGLGSSLFTWSEFEKYLSENYRLVRIDIPGFGLSEFPSGGDVSARAWAEAIEALCAHLKISSFIGIGNSMGARALIEVTLREKIKPRALVLLNSAGLTHPKSSFPVLTLAKIPGIRQLIKYYSAKTLVARSLRHAYGPHTMPSAGTIDRTFDLMLFPGHRQAFINVANSPDRTIDPKKLQSIHLPVLYLWGRHDRITPVELAEVFVANTPGAQLHIFENLGHVPMEESPAEVAAVTMQFLKKIK